jgi:hypothetical protein
MAKKIAIGASKRFTVERNKTYDNIRDTNSLSLLIKFKQMVSAVAAGTKEDGK